MTYFCVGVAVGAAVAYLAMRPELVKGWIEAVRAKIGK